MLVALVHVHSITLVRHLNAVSRGAACMILILATAAGEAAANGGRQPVRSLLELRQDKVVVQKWDLSCGAAALATLLSISMVTPFQKRNSPAA